MINEKRGLKRLKNELEITSLTFTDKYYEIILENMTRLLLMRIGEKQFNLMIKSIRRKLEKAGFLNPTSTTYKFNERIKK